jgi:hypothetical protein
MHEARVPVAVLILAFNERSAGLRPARCNAVPPGRRPALQCNDCKMRIGRVQAERVDERFREASDILTPWKIVELGLVSSLQAVGAKTR